MLNLVTYLESFSGELCRATLCTEEMREFWLDIPILLHTLKNASEFKSFESYSKIFLKTL